MNERADRAPSAESGAVLVWVAIMLPLLIGFVALALDVGNWYLRAQRSQNAADAAALAGAVHMPGSFEDAEDAARDIAAANGFSGDEVTVLRTSKPSQLRVQVSRSDGNIFGGFLGILNTRITRDAIAEFQPPVPMGSPANTYGNEPTGGGEQRWSNTFTGTDQPRFWASIAGPETEKVQGDAFHSDVCTSTTTDLCAGSDNAEYNPNGNVYVVRVPAKPSGAAELRLEVFDPAFVMVGSTCASNLDFATAARNPHVTDPEQRYARGASPFCSGDQHYPSSASSTREMTTTFVVRAPSDTPWDPLSGEVVDTGSCRPTQYAGFEGPLAVELTAPGGNDALQQVFRRWVRLCTITTPVAGDYVLQVRTNVRPGATAAQMAGVGDRTTPGGGSNKYALRAAYVDPAGLPVPANVRVFSMSSMSIFANAPATTEFHLARLPSGSGGKTLVLSLFDIADATRPADLHMIGPPGTTFTGCSITGAVTRTLPDCVVHDAVTDDFNGRWARIRIPIPPGYTCNDGDPQDCWVKIRFAYATVDSQVTDVTTWAASLEGDPVRLVE